MWFFLLFNKNRIGDDMKKINIIKKTQDFEYIMRNGRLLKNNYYIIYTAPKMSEYYRFGLSVGKKISNKAVIRNKLKRMLKSIIDNNKNIYQKDRDYIIIMKRSCLEANYQELENSFIEIMKKIR